LAFGLENKLVLQASAWLGNDLPQLIGGFLSFLART